MQRVFGASIFLLAVVACSSSSSNAQPTTNGVNDVLKACEIRAQWTKTSASPCINCIAYSTTPRCPCADVDYAGECSTQQAAKTNEPSCQGVDTCVNACAKTDCACVEACYANRAACKPQAAAVDGCVADVCDAECR